MKNPVIHFKERGPKGLHADIGSLKRFKIIGVVEMFSEKKLSPAQFEMLGIFCDHISKEISMLYDIGEFLSIR
jgi:hypothetical protein